MQPARFHSGFRDVAPAAPDASLNTAITQKIMDREARIAWIQQHGELYLLSVDLGLPSPAAAAGTQKQALTPSQDFDLVVIAAHSNLYLSQIEIVDSARNRSLTNGPAPIYSFASFANAAARLEHFDWVAPYLLPARSQFKIVTTADGTETAGRLTFICKQPPTYTS
jgi:hypothetical protein